MLVVTEEEEKVSETIYLLKVIVSTTQESRPQETGRIFLNLYRVRDGLLFVRHLVDFIWSFFFFLLFYYLISIVCNLLQKEIVVQFPDSMNILRNLMTMD